MPYLSKGTVLNCPDGGGYILTRDVEVGEVLRPSQFEAFGGVDPVKGGEMVPKWLWPEMKRMHEEQGMKQNDTLVQVEDGTWEKAIPARLPLTWNEKIATEGDFFSACGVFIAAMCVSILVVILVMT